MNNVYFVSGIDTDAGKSYATAYIAKMWNRIGIKTITQKFIQTGNSGSSEDIELHRKIMEMEFLEDKEGLTAPEIFSYPASPLLASKIDNREINFNKIEKATAVLSERYDRVLLEGAGGLMVPLTEKMLTIDYLMAKGYPLIFVTNGKLGSVNHTLLSLEAIERRGIQIAIFAYNLFPIVEENIIQEDTKLYFRDCVAKRFPSAEFLEIPVL